ncbi:MAG: hypothetical protein WA751_10100 [Candidatus Dormiibacterota bacterium]
MARVPPHFYLNHRVGEGFLFYHVWEEECSARTRLAKERWARVDGTGGNSECDICRRLSETDEAVAGEPV